jgi:hypothetical protein
MLNSRLPDRPRSWAAVTIPHEVHPPFNRNELERAAGRHMGREVSDIAFADFVHFAERILIFHE